MEKDQVVALYQPGRECFRDGFPTPYVVNDVSAKGVLVVLQVGTVAVLEQRL